MDEDQRQAGVRELDREVDWDAEDRSREGEGEDARSPSAAPHKNESQPQSAERPAKGSLVKRGIIAAVAIALLGGAAYFGQYWWTTGRYYVTTDDAYVGARNATLSPKVSGYISEVAVDDNATVKAGDVIARIDDGDYKLAVQTAKDQVAVQQASIERLGKQVVAQEASVDQAKAQLNSAKAGEIKAGQDLKRQQDLANRQINSRQSLEQAQAAYDQAVAAVQAADAAVESAAANVDVIKAQKEEAARTLKQLETALAKAERDLTFTVLRAPFDGVMGNRAVQVGDYVQPTQRLASLVPLEAVYIDANFKETQFNSLQAGQPVTISIDALPGRKLVGRVASFAPASGSVFSLLPPDNATGNFTKIVQRLPVRIQLPVSVAEQSVLRPGMSVVVSVNTKPGAVAASQPMSTASLRTAVK
jgi:membrane fusion protein (multidrug efflux system)